MLPVTLLLLAGVPAEPALDQLARATAEQALKALPQPPVAIWVDGSTPALARAFASLLAAELARRKLAPVVLDAPSAAAAERSAREKDFRTLLRLSVTAENAQVVARGDALHTWVNFWAGAAPTRTFPAAAIAARAEADLAVSTLASTTPAGVPAAAPLKLAVSVLARLAAPPAALAVGDLDGDRHPEIAVLTDDEVLLFSGDGRPLARYDLRLLPASPRPGRESHGALAIAPGRLAWLSGRRAHGETLIWANGALKPAGATDEVSLDGVTVRLVPGLNACSAEVGWFGKPLTLAAPLTTASARGGLTLFVFANGTAALSRGAPPAAGLSQAPSGATLADLDGDGQSELVVTSSRFFPETDELKVVAGPVAEALAARSGALGEAPLLWAGPTPRGRALVAAAGDLDGDGADEVVLGAWLPDGSGELQLARRIAP